MSICKKFDDVELGEALPICHKIRSDYKELQTHVLFGCKTALTFNSEPTPESLDHSHLLIK